jgi:phosphate transport system permease protein
MTDPPDRTSASGAPGAPGGTRAAGDPGADGLGDQLPSLDLLSGGGFDPSAPLTRSGNLRRRQRISSVMQGAQTGAAVIALAVLGVVIYSVASHGASALNLDFFTQGPPEQAEAAGGGIAPELVGTALLMVVATAIALPTGVMIALYLTEFATPKVARALRLVLDLLNGVPTILIGLVLFGLLVAGHGETGFYASLALAIIMLPLVARAAQEMLLLVPTGMREAADALGVSRWRAVRGVVLPSAIGGILTATILAVARAAGETAPLLLLSDIFGRSVTLGLFGQALPNIPVYILEASEQASQYGFARAWGAAFVLLTFIVLASLLGRVLMARSRAKLVG